MKRADEKRPPSIYLCAPVNALVQGLYEENVRLSEVKKHGDFGLGTFNDLDGEMIMLDGAVYQVSGDGRVKEIREDVLTPFACVTFYRALSEDTLETTLDTAGFNEWLLKLLPSSNIFYAIRFEGLFRRIRTRSVPRQDNYKPLVEVAKEQPEFEFENVEGTLAGFFTPSFMASINVPGLHLHFLSSDRTCGGHLLRCEPARGRVGIQFIPRLELGLPMTLDYLTGEFDRDVRKDLDRAEK